MGMKDEIAAMGIIDSALRGGFPRLMGEFIIGISANKIYFCKVFKLSLHRVDEVPANHKVE